MDTNFPNIQEHGNAFWNDKSMHGRRDILNEALEQAAQSCSLEYLWSLDANWRQEIIDRIVGRKNHDEIFREFSLVLTKEGEKQLKKIGNGCQICFKGQPVKFKAGTPREVSAKQAISIYYEFGPQAEDVAKRGAIQEHAETEASEA